MPPRRAAAAAVQPAKRPRKAPCLYSPVTEKPVKRAARGRGSGKPAATGPFVKHVTAIKALLAKLRQAAALLDAYEGDGWRGASREKLKPTAELEAARQRILESKLRIRDHLRALDESNGEVSIPAEHFDAAGEVDEEKIFCACCLSAEADDDNDIVLCDGDCSRAYHLRCLQPPLTLADLPADEEEGWLCPACDAKVDAVYELNAAFDAAWPLDAKWSDFFAAEAAGAEAAAAEDWPSEDEEDADFDPRAARAEAAAAAAEEEGSEEGGEEGEGEEASEEETESDDSEGAPPPPRRRTRAAGAAASASLPSSESESESESEAEEEAAVVLEGKRRRPAVNYVALAAEMFGSPEGGAGLLSDDDAEYLGASPLPSPVASPRAAAGEGPRRFPAETLAALRAAFAISQLPSRAEKEALAARAGLTLAQVSIWFNNARQKQKRAAAAAAPAGACEARRAPAGATTAALLSPPKSQWPIAPGSDGDDADFERGPSEPDVSMLSGEEAAEGRAGPQAAQGKQAAKTR